METLHEFMLITKGREYLIAIGFLGLFIIFWKFLATGGVLPVAAGAFKHLDFRLPEGVFYCPGHTLALPTEDGSILIGLDDFLRQATGTIEEVATSKSGTRIKRGEPLLHIRIESEMIRIPSPISGVVKGVDTDVGVGMKLPLHQETLEDNWWVRILPEDATVEDTRMKTAREAGRWLQAEMEKLHNFLDAQSSRPSLAGVTLADGGEPVAGVLRLLDPEGIRLFEKEFLHL